VVSIYSKLSSGSIQPPLLEPAVPTTPMNNLVKLSSTWSVSFTDVHAYRRLIGSLCISLIPDLTSHFLFNNFLSFLISLQLLTIMHQLEFSNILKELQVLVYFSILVFLLISKLFVIVIGAPVVIQDNQWLILVCNLEIPYILEIKEARNNIKEFLWSWIQDNGHCYLWNSMTSLSSSRFESSFWATISFTLWQWLSKIYCNKSSVSWAHQTYRNRQSHC